MSVAVGCAGATPFLPHGSWNDVKYGFAGVSQEALTATPLGPTAMILGVAGTYAVQMIGKCANVRNGTRVHYGLSSATAGQSALLCGAYSCVSGGIDNLALSGSQLTQAEFTYYDDVLNDSAMLANVPVVGSRTFVGSGGTYDMVVSVQGRLLVVSPPCELRFAFGVYAGDLPVPGAAPNGAVEVFLWRVNE